ncbi:hypothetical protein H8356DRAFT_1322176 [Neocallimastix lanati (nom. inval.)]|nr:hypothetical protein H8356DRAFT_1322176 [Neocallimastix sp. JGI-2020a]
MAEGKLRRLTENENQDCTAEPPNKKRRKENKKSLSKILFIILQPVNIVNKFFPKYCSCFKSNLLTNSSSSIEIPIIISLISGFIAFHQYGVLHKLLQNQSFKTIYKIIINSAYICKGYNCVGVNKEGHKDTYINLSDDNGNISPYILAILVINIVSLNAIIMKLIIFLINAPIFQIAYIINGLIIFCTFNDKSSIEYYNNIYKHFYYIEYSYIYCGKAPECASKKCENGLCEILETYDMHKIRVIGSSYNLA